MNIMITNRIEKVLLGNRLAHSDVFFHEATCMKRLNDWNRNILYIVPVSNTKEFATTCHKYNFDESVDYVW